MDHLAVSNLAWDKSQDNDVALLMNKYGFGGLELAPTKVWDKPEDITAKEIEMYKLYWNKKGIEIVSMQSLLYGHPEFVMFESEDMRVNTLDYLRKIISLASKLGCHTLVFGSPKNRFIGKQNTSLVYEIARNFFFDLAEHSKSENIIFCLEPVPVNYGADFINTHSEALTFIKSINHPNLRVNIDTSTLFVNGEDPNKLFISENMKYFGHMHISEPKLQLLQFAKYDHKTVANLLKILRYNKWKSIEIMNNRLARLEKVFKQVKTYYG